jgi:hypothetical protein
VGEGRAGRSTAVASLVPFSLARSLPPCPLFCSLAELVHWQYPGCLDWLEEAIRDESPEAYESLRALTPQPFALGEEFASKWQFLPYIEKGLCNFARVDICNVGGFTEALKVAGWAEAHYIDLMPHNPLGPICTGMHDDELSLPCLLARSLARSSPRPFF